MTQCVVADLSASKPRERELYTIPISSSWFRWEEIHETERRSLPEFFDGGSYSRSPRIYKEYRDFIINKYREDPARRLTFTDVRKSLVGDVGTLRKVFLFLEKWGLVNFRADDGKHQRQQQLVDGCGPQVVVEDGPPAGVRVVPTPSGSSTASRAQTGGEIGFELPALTSYCDAFGEWTPGSGLVCGACGGQCSLGFSGLVNDGVTICSNCSSKLNMENAKTEDDIKPVDLVNGKNQSANVWTDAETLLLLEAVLKHGDDWDLIAQHVRTKNKLDCISRLIYLPFGEHMLGTICSKSNSAILATSEYLSSLDVLKDNVRVSIEADVEVQNDVTKTENGDGANVERPLKRRCLPSFTDPTDSLMKQVASLSALSCPNVTAAALDAAIQELCHENPCARLAFETDGEEITKPSSSTFKNIIKSDINVEDKDADRGGDAKIDEQSDHVHTIIRIRAAIATALAATAARAKLIADQEEREMELLMASIIQAQLKKLRYKMKHLIDVGLIMEKEYSLLQQLKDSMMEEWITVLRKLFHAGIPRWRDQGFPKNLLHTN